MIKKDCRFFEGSKPCRWNKEFAYECSSCNSYSKCGEKILIVKLDAIGDVLRTTCIIPKIKERFPFAYITWITMPESIELLLSNPDIDEVWEYNDTETICRLRIQKWDYVYSLDNSHSGASLSTIVKAGHKAGFTLSEDGKVTPTNNSALMWLTMAVFDRVKKENTKSYQEIMYDICGFNPPVSRPSLTLPENLLQWADSLIDKFFPERKSHSLLLGINIGSGNRWAKKMLDTRRIVDVISALLNDKPEWHIVLLGGANEAAKAEKIAKIINSKNVVNAGCNYNILQFGAIIKRCDTILCGDTLSLHIASAVNTPAVVLFGPTSSAEIYEYDGLIKKIVAKDIDCLCCYSNCTKKDNCMSLIPTHEIIAGIKGKIKIKSFK